MQRWMIDADPPPSGSWDRTFLASDDARSASGADMTRIVFVGECMVEVAPSHDGLHRVSYAGDTFNMAWYLARLRPDWHVDYLTDIGSDAVSDTMFAEIGKAGIGTGAIRRRTDATVGLYLVTLRDGERSFAYWRDRSAARGLADDADRLDAALVGADAVVISGITLAILPAAGRKTLISALTRARAAGSLVGFDPNLRSALWSDADTMRAAIMDAASISDVVWPSFGDEADAFGDTDPETTLSRYRDAGVREVAVKDGAGPVVFMDGDAIRSHAPEPVDEIIDTTAAGDSFDAAWLAARLIGEPPSIAVARACALSARVIGGRGALVPV